MRLIDDLRGVDVRRIPAPDAGRHPKAQEKAIIIAGSVDEAIAYAEDRIAGIDAELLRIEDQEATIQNEIGVRVVETMRLEASLADMRQQWADRPGSLRDLNAELARIDGFLDGHRQSLAQREERLAEISAAPDILADRIAAYVEEQAALEASADELAQTAADARGIDALVNDGPRNAELDQVLARLAYVRDEVIPAISASKLDAEREAADLAGLMEVNREQIAALEAERADTLAAWDELLAWRGDMQGEINAASNELAAAMALIEGDQAQLAAYAGQRAALEAERAEMQQVLDEAPRQRGPWG